MQYIFEDNLEKLSQQRLKIVKKTLKTRVLMTSLIMFIIILLWFLCFIDIQLKNKNNNAESLDFGGDPMAQKTAAPTKIKITFIIYNNIEKNL